MSDSTLHEFTALIPAGGTGSRVGADRPKQFLALAGRPMLSWTIAALLDRPWIKRVMVVVSSGMADADRSAVEAGLIERDPRLIWLPIAGATRRDTVLNGLTSLAGTDDDDWVMVHDAARPGLSAALLERLRATIVGGASGALAATPVADTIKRASMVGKASVAAATVPRDGLWLAQTPQVFQVATLRDALRRHADVTDEAGAIERTGVAPVLVPGEWQNLKVTTHDDLTLMAMVLGQQKPD